jgi:hypothetical protein
MSLPTAGDVHVNAPLTDMSVQYAQSLDKFGADKLAPIMPSDKQTNLFFKFTKSYWGRDEMKVRGPGSEAVEAGYGVETDSFACIGYAVKKMIADQVRSNEDNPLNSDRNAMQFVTQLERIRREKAFAAACLATSKWSTDKAGVAGTPTTNQFKQWNDSASTPIENIRAYCTEIELLTLGAARPNVLGISQPVWDALADHPDIVDRLKYGGQLAGALAKVSPDMVAALLGLDEIVILSAVENTALEGATAAASYIAGKGAVLLYRNTTPSIESVTAVRTFTWKNYLATDAGFRIKKYRDEGRASDVVEMESAFVHKIAAQDAGAYLATVVA